MRVRQALDTEGRLNLWQIQAILGKSRDYSLSVLSRLTCHPDVALTRQDERIQLTLSQKR
jgi:hypothetical protein